jgi:4'-phosphopantetheinyl transferase
MLESAEIGSLWPLLDESERSKANRFHMAADRDAYVTAHALLRATLSSVMNTIHPSNWRFRNTKTGKPVLDPLQAPPDLHFSLSHTRGLAACAVGRPHALGIDAEAWRTPAPIDLAARYFAPAEARLVTDKTEPGEQISTFYRLWTLKEAYLKGTGQGLAAPLDSFAFRLDPLAVSVGGQDPMADWRFAEFRPSPAHSLALAVQSPEPIQIDDAPMTRRDCLDYADACLSKHSVCNCLSVNW